MPDVEADAPSAARYLPRHGGIVAGSWLAFPHAELLDVYRRRTRSASSDANSESELRVADHEASDEAPRLLDHPEEPLHPDPLHPERRRRVRPATTSIAPPTPITNGTPSSALCSESQYSFFGDCIAAKSMSGSSRADLVDHLGVLLGAEVAVAVAGDHEPRMPPAQVRDRLFEHVLLRAEDEDAVALLLGDGEEAVHQVGGVDALGERVAEEPRGPNDALAVGADDRALAP